MKKVNVKYILPGKDWGKVVQRYLIENEADIQTAHDLKLIGPLHKAGMRNLLAKGDRIILNENGGYCGIIGHWEIVSHWEIIK